MRITQRLAEDLAKMLTAKKDAAINKAKKELSAYADKIYLKTIPKEVLVVFEKHRSYMSSASYIYVNGIGIGHQYVDLSKSYPSKSSNTLLASEKECKEIKVLLDKYNSLKEKKRLLLKQTETALLTLSTSKRVAEQFPELTDYLNKLDNGKLVPVANIEQLKKELRTN